MVNSSANHQPAFPIRTHTQVQGILFTYHVHGKRPPFRTKNTYAIVLIIFFFVLLLFTNKTRVFLNILVRLQVVGRGAVFIAVKSLPAWVLRYSGKTE
jgi:hypothetical protein